MPFQISVEKGVLSSEPYGKPHNGQPLRIAIHTEGSLPLTSPDCQSFKKLNSEGTIVKCACKLYVLLIQSDLNQSSNIEVTVYTKKRNVSLPLTIFLEWIIDEDFQRIIRTGFQEYLREIAHIHRNMFNERGDEDAKDRSTLMLTRLKECADGKIKFSELAQSYPVFFSSFLDRLEVVS